MHVALPVLALLATACTMHNDTPNRHQSLPLFEPYRTEFTCVHEVDVVPPIDPQAERWFQEARQLERSPYPERRDYAGAAKLYAQAAELKHWKAILNLATLTLEGRGVPADREKAIQLVEQAMQWGVPSAYDRMGTYIENGIVHDGDRVTRAYAFYQRAADMGSATAQTHLGSQMLVAKKEYEWGGQWANVPIGTKMLECAFAQGNGEAAYELSAVYAWDSRDRKKEALHVLHEGVKFGSAKCAARLASEFRGINLTETYGIITRIDLARAKRYSAIDQAFTFLRGQTLPNLDRVLPLPPAKLPFWDGQPESLIEAAKPIAERPAPKQAAVVYPHPPEKLGYTIIDFERYEIPAGQVLYRVLDHA